MGVAIYYILVAIVLVFGLLMPQEGPKRKYYIIFMALLHTFVCGFRYMYLTGDLRKYAWDYFNQGASPFSLSAFWHQGRNSLYFFLSNLFSVLTNGDFQIFLMFIAIVTEFFLALLIYRYSPKPWLSYFVWNCLAFYVFGFSAIKQALAMGILMWAALAIFERKPVKFLCIMALAYFIHAPSLCFLPAYWLGNRRVNAASIWMAVFFTVVIFFFRTPIVSAISPLYYRDETFIMSSSDLGLRFFFIAGLLALGILIKGFEERGFRIVFNLLIVAAIFQMFSAFDNIFTRLADYYFQFSVLYIPMLFTENSPALRLEAEGHKPLFHLQPRLRQLAVIAAAGMLMLYYYQTQLRVHITYSVDDYLNFRFMWDV